MSKDTTVERRMLVATESFCKRYQGADMYFHAGITRVREGEPILKGIEHLFKPIDAHYDVEQATKAPGEVRDAK